MDKKEHSHLPLRYLLFILTFLCAAGIVVSFLYPPVFTAVKNKADSFLMPMQVGLNRIGGTLAERYEFYRTLSDAQEENLRLKESMEELKEQNLILYQQTYELSEMRKLLAMKDRYAEYEMVGVNVIQKETGNWYHEFLIDKGSADGVFLNANVIAGGALLGRVIYVGKNYSRVLSIIDDDSNVSAMSQESGDFCIVSGNLELYKEGQLSFGYADKEATIEPGNLLVTSHVSDIFLPNLAIGYVESINLDPNNLTRSGKVVPLADFSTLKQAMVILTSREDWVEDETTAPAPESSAAAGAEIPGEAAPGGEAPGEAAPAGEAPGEAPEEEGAPE